MMPVIASPRAIDDMWSLIALITNPKGATEALKKIQEAETALAERMAEFVARQDAAAKAQADFSELVRSQGAHARELAAKDAQIRADAEALNQRQAEFDQASETHEIAMRQANAAAAAQEKALAERTAELSQRNAAADKRDAQLKRGETALAAREGRVAEAEAAVAARQTALAEFVGTLRP